MTPTEGVVEHAHASDVVPALARLFERLVVTAREPLGLVLDPSARTYWLFLLAAALTAVVVLALQRARGQSVALAEVPRRWLHRSARVDYGLILVKPLLAAIVVLPAGLSAWGLAVALVRQLDRWLGVPDAPAVPALMIAAIYTIVLFVLWDASRYILHRWMHRFPVLWSFHQVHHSAEVLTPLTLYRTHPVESALYTLRGILVSGLVTGVFFYWFRRDAVELELLGINALGFLFNMIGGNLRHSHIWWSWGERMERWFISPAQHQLHHQRDERSQRVNYGTALAIWDRAAGSLQTASAALVRDDFGVAEAARNHDPRGLLSALIDPVIAAGVGLGRRLGRGSTTGLMALVGVAGLMSAPALTHAAPAPAPEDEAADVDLDLSEEPRANEPGGDEVDLDLSDLSDQPADAPAGDEATGEGADSEADAGASAASPVSVTRTRGPDLQTDTVSIIGDPERLPRVVGSAYVVDDATLERRENDDIHRVLQAVPGIYVRGEDGFGLRPNIGMRGVDPNRSSKVTLMEDGVLLGPAPYAAPAAYYFPVITRMVGVEVFKGPSSIRYGPNTIGGAINLQTRPIPRSNKAGLDLGVGQYGYGKAHGYWGTSWKRFGVLIEGVRLQSSGFKELDGGGDTGFGKNEIMVKGRAHGDPGARVYQQFDIKLGLSTERSNETYLGLSDADFLENPYRRYVSSGRDEMNWLRTQAQISHLVALGERFEFQITAYRHDFSRSWNKFNGFRGADIRDVLNYPDSGQSAVYLAVLRGEEDSIGPEQTILIGDNQRSYVSQGVQAVTRVRSKTKFVDQDIEIGARVHYDEILRNHTEDGFSMVSGTLVPTGEETQRTADNRGVAIAGAFHLHDEITIVDRVTVAPGGRLEIIETSFRNRLAADMTEPVKNLDVAFMPGVGLHVEVTRWLGVLAGVHSGFSPVSPGQPEDVKPERSVNYEGGLRARAGGLKAEAIGFVTDYSNLTGECTFAQGCDDMDVGQQFNAGDVFTAGLEALAGYRHDWARGWLQGQATYTYTWSRFGSTFSSGNPQWGDVEEGDLLPYVPAHVAGLGLAGGMRRFQLHGDLRYIGEMRDVPGQGPIDDIERIAANVVLDLGGGVLVTDHVSLYTVFRNVTASKYMVARRPFGARPGRPFSFMVGLKASFG